jgi:hypothetical protein
LTTEHDECTGESFQTFTVSVFTNNLRNDFVVFKWTMVV